MKVEVVFERREDGGLRVHSEDVPGFVLSHADCSAVMADVRPALEEILSSMLGCRVTASPLPSLAQVLGELGEPPERTDSASYERDYLVQVDA